MSLKIGQSAPDFTADALLGKEFVTVKLNDYKGKWVVLFFYPLDFTFVCPTEIIEFNERLQEFKDRGVEVLGASIDSKFSHLGWSESHPGLANLQYPLLSDLTKRISADYDVLNEEAGFALRGTFIIDPEQKVRWITVNDAPVGRNVDEVLRVLDALQSGNLTPCGWKKGDKTL
jgi:alkyl hydroperoxide reductase subunit AhpC